MLVAWAGLAPDLDGLGVILDWCNGHSHYYCEYHHRVTHSLLACVVFAVFSSLWAKQQRMRVSCLTLVATHLHLLADLLGSKGPDDYIWPIYYWSPFSETLQLSWTQQWPLNGWQNMVILLALLLCCGGYAHARQVSFLELFSRRLDQAALILLKRIFPDNPG